MTIRQIQHLLAYLGYYAGTIDGIWGTLSRDACTAFQADFGLEADGVAGAMTQDALRHAVACGMENQAAVRSSSTVVPSFWENIRYFTRSEFGCKCGRCGGFPAEPAELLVNTADNLRGHFGKPITVSSGVRCTAHNAEVGGVSNSRHLSGKAMDFSVQGVSPATVLAYVQRLPEIRYAYAIDGNYLHMDIL